VAVVGRTPDWHVIAEWGRKPVEVLPTRFMDEALDREAGGWSDDLQSSWPIIGVPLSLDAARQEMFLMSGRNLTADSIVGLMAVARLLTHCLRIGRIRDKSAKRGEQLRRTLSIASTFAGAREMQPLLDLIANEATQLLECDRASIFIWVRDDQQLIACPALGVKGGTLRLPDNVGIVGEVIQKGETIRVDDAYQDSRFNKEVDKKSGYRTRTILSVPMKNAEGELLGAFQVLNKKESLFDDDDEEILTLLGIQAAVAMHNTREREELIRSHQQLTEQVTQGSRIIGESAAIVALRETLKRLAATDLPVLVLGESGTGKEIVSQSLHYQGPRSKNPLIAVNCAALTETLLETELFGHEKGAFTDAHEMRKGKFELADGGTLFLDEIGDMSLGGQAKLLRVLEEKVITRVGGAEAIPINVRVIAATNTKLAESVRDKRFREDLYYRLSVVTLDLPSLRERPEDVLPLAEFFLDRFSMQAGRGKLVFSAEARRRIQSHSWPGNVRELRNLMERVAFLCPDTTVEINDLAFILSPVQKDNIEIPFDLGLAEATNQFQRTHIRESIKRMNGNMSETAKLLGLHRSNLYRKMRQLQMSEAGAED
jgi:Nif-specific regulatory protein